ncbi:uncharacterized protein METZ01_LOCUS139317 [marine metagenome]|uniref:Uncharacterized protein n=1 Tax=marine metagenome TaxID=408172 RepID=A0A381ZCI8_9ZZZZ
MFIWLTTDEETRFELWQSLSKRLYNPKRWANLISKDLLDSTPQDRWDFTTREKSKYWIHSVNTASIAVASSR